MAFSRFIRALFRTEKENRTEDLDVGLYLSPNSLDNLSRKVYLCCSSSAADDRDKLLGHGE